MFKCMISSSQNSSVHIVNTILFQQGIQATSRFIPKTAGRCCRLLSSWPSSCSARAWAQKNPDLARDCLEVPSVVTDSTTHYDDDDDRAVHESPSSLEEYLQLRRWSLPTSRSSSTAVGDNENKDIDSTQQHGTTLLSHPLSYPLTLASMSRQFATRAAAQRGGSQKTSEIRIACLGARAEATLPVTYWREFLAYQTLYHNNNNDLHWHLDFIGPDVPPGLQTQRITAFDHPTMDNNMDDSARHNTTTNEGGAALELSFYRGYLQDYCYHHQTTREHTHDDTGTRATTTYARRKTVPVWDGVVLFNPGIGHPNLMEGWTTTMRTLLRATSPILMTAHSALDADRDRDRIRELQRQEFGESASSVVCNYGTNAFASRLEFEDPFDASHRVRPNHSMMMLLPSL